MVNIFAGSIRIQEKVTTMTVFSRIAVFGCGTILAAGAAGASTIPVASLDSTGTLSFSASGGLVISGGLTATYNGAPGGTRPYIVEASLETGNTRLTPSVTVSTPDLSTPSTPVPDLCLPFVGCTPLPDIPGIPIPSQSFSFDLPIPLPLDVTLFDESWTSPPVPLGPALAFDFGNLLIGQPLSLGDVVRDQFESGATDWSVSGSLGPVDGSIDYFGTLLGNTITATYELVISAPTILAQLEGYALDLLNDNVGLFADLALNAFLDQLDCSTPLIGQFLCDTVAGLPIGEEGGLTLALNSLGTLSSDFSYSKLITPAPIPLPAGFPLLLGGLGLLGLARRRAQRRA